MSHDIIKTNNTAIVKKMFAEMERKDIDSWISHWSDKNAKQFIPYAPDGFPDVVEGKENLRKIYHELIGGYGKLKYTYINIYPMNNKDMVVAEWGVDIEVLATGKHYQNELIGIFSFNEGKVIELKEYFNPEKFKNAIEK